MFRIRIQFGLDLTLEKDTRSGAPIKETWIRFHKKKPDQDPTKNWIRPDKNRHFILPFHFTIKIVEKGELGRFSQPNPYPDPDSTKNRICISRSQYEVQCELIYLYALPIFCNCKANKFNINFCDVKF